MTLEKSEKHYPPTTFYNDCHAETPTGRRYLRIRPGSDRRALLFVRERRHDERGETMPYMLLGHCFYRSHRGGRPMQIEWTSRAPRSPRAEATQRDAA